jgi:hypothetical protein
MAVSNKAQVGVVAESTYGTPVVVTKFYDFITEGFKRAQDRMESKSLRSLSHVLTTDNWALGKVDVSGSMDMEMRPKGMGFWFNQALGTVVTTQPAVSTDPLVYLHTFTPGPLPTSFTTQIAKPDITDTAQPFTYQGCRIKEWDLDCKVGDFAGLKVTVIGQEELTATSLAVASYPTGNKPYRFIDGTVTIGGVASDVTGLTFKGANNLADQRYFLGSVFRKQPLENALRDLSGSFDTEFNGLTNYNRFISGAEATVVLLFAGAVISNAFMYQTKITMNVRFDGETPTVAGPSIVTQALPFKVIDNGTLSIKVEYQTTDITP